MPKVEYGINYQRVAELQSELESLKVERMNAFIDGNTTQVEYYTSRMAEVTTELEALNVLGN
jgi:hypothetical protein